MGGDTRGKERERIKVRDGERKDMGIEGGGDRKVGRRKWRRKGVSIAERERRRQDGEERERKEKKK